MCFHVKLRLFNEIAVIPGHATALIGKLFLLRHDVRRGLRRGHTSPIHAAQSLVGGGCITLLSHDEWLLYPLARSKAISVMQILIFNFSYVLNKWLIVIVKGNVDQLNTLILRRL
jgi:hypothetical protein